MTYPLDTKDAFSRPQVVGKVYAAINRVQTDLAAIGITKDRKNDQQGYKFRGIDDVYNTISPLLAKHGLCILPQFVSREVTERQTNKGGTLFYVVVCGNFSFVSAEDGSQHIVMTYGEAMDSGDKATNKAMSAAYKYACMQAFSIPTEGDNDADTHTHAPMYQAPEVDAALLEAAKETASKGREAFAHYWKGLQQEQRNALMPHMDGLKKMMGDGHAG